MLHPLIIFSQSDYLIQFDATNSYTMTNSEDPDQKPTDLDLHCLQRQGSAGLGLKHFVGAKFHRLSSVSTICVVFISPACSRVRYRRPIFRPSIRLSTFMSTFDIYVKVSILINYKTKQPSNLA